MGLFKRKQRRPGFERELDRIKAELAVVDVNSEEYKNLLNRADSIANLIDMEGRDSAINKIEIAKLGLQALMFGAALYADLNGHIVLKNPLHKFIQNRGGNSEMRRREVFNNKRR